MMERRRLQRDLVKVSFYLLVVMSITCVGQYSGGDAEEEEAEIEGRPLKCSEKAFRLSSVCKLKPEHTGKFGEYVTLGDLSSLIFHEDIVQQLMDDCAPGEWCLAKDWDLRYDALEFLHFCDLNACLLNMSDECVTKEREMAISGLRMLCEMDQEVNITRNCFLSIHKVLQVEMADFQRIQYTDAEDHKDVCDKKKDKILCSGPCQTMALNLHCMDDSCQSKLVKAFRQFNNWQWFFDMINPDTTCGYNATDDGVCRFFQPQSSWLAKIIHDHPILKPLEDTGGTAAFGVFMGMLFILGTIGALGWLIVRRVRGRSSVRDRMDYMEVDSSKDIPNSDFEEEMETTSMLDD